MAVKVSVVALRDWWLLGALPLFFFFALFFPSRRLSSRQKSALPLKVLVDISSSFKVASAQGISGY